MTTTTLTHSEAHMLETMKCYCGNRAKLHYRDMPGRVEETVVVVKKAPAYLCDRCGEEILDGPTSLKFAERVKTAVENNLPEIDF